MTATTPSQPDKDTPPVNQNKNNIPSPANKALLAAIIESSRELIAVMDEDSRLLVANSAFRELFEQVYGHAIDTNDRMLAHMPDETGRISARLIERTLSAGRQQLDQQYFVADKRYDIEWSLNKVALENGATGVALFGRDITSRRIAEETLRERNNQLHHSQKMEAVGTLAGGTAHEFNNALSIVLGSLELAEMGFDADHPGRVYLKDAKSGILRAKKVVRQLLDFSRKSDHRPQEIDLHTITTHALNLLRASIPSHIEFHEHIDTGLSVMGETSHLHQMIMNLCTNAADAMDRDGGVLTVTLERARLRADNMPGSEDLVPGPYARLTVADTGQGIAKENLKRIFEPFYTTKGPDQSSGMGLAVVHGIVKTHAGDITVRSQLGGGTKFDIYLPTHHHAKAEPAPPNPATLTGNERVLFVDDEPQFVINTQRQLEQMGYRLEVFTSPTKALARFREAPDQFDMVISDVAMPKMTGEKLINQIRQIRPAIPAILITGYSDKIDRQAAEIIGCLYAIKPIQIDYLAQLVRKAIDRK